MIYFTFEKSTLLVIVEWNCSLISQVNCMYNYVPFVKLHTRCEITLCLIQSIRGTLRSWGHLSCHYHLVKTGPMLRIFWLKNNFSDLSRYIKCKFKWNWNTKRKVVQKTEKNERNTTEHYLQPWLSLHGAWVPNHRNSVLFSKTWNFPDLFFLNSKACFGGPGSYWDTPTKTWFKKSLVGLSHLNSY